MKIGRWRCRYFPDLKEPTEDRKYRQFLLQFSHICTKNIKVKKKLIGFYHNIKFSEGRWPLFIWTSQVSSFTRTQKKEKHRLSEIKKRWKMQEDFQSMTTRRSLPKKNQKKRSAEERYVTFKDEEGTVKLSSSGPGQVPGQVQKVQGPRTKTWTWATT